jgi:hypothetical protein
MPRHAGQDYLCPDVAASDAHTASEASEPASAVKLPHAPRQCEEQFERL